jgi:hypothetical protein
MALCASAMPTSRMELTDELYVAANATIWPHKLLNNHNAKISRNLLHDNREYLTRDVTAKLNASPIIVAKRYEIA